ncbi:hypothetical protein L211DRAFT_256857 [Terfezia boudieri ATCC MYA-4762]|uniref:Uncharacterized protein n=1 Tax=Terfezia boudieri ATCC MYA-4762 TaxID=1051890 RepID=A0A3N4M217_9PEZI|nr:hypothetical protein L211DRAFT_256857 [Terfezia boudieri ATCC MYA-4762]
MVVAFDTMYQLILTTPSHTINPLDLPLVGHICAFHTVSTFLLLGIVWPLRHFSHWGFSSGYAPFCF